MAFHFRLTYSDGDDAGDFVTAAPDWNVGDVFRTGDGRRLRIVRMVPIERIEEFEERPTHALWEVETVEPRTSRLAAENVHDALPADPELLRHRVIGHAIAAGHAH